MLYRLQLSRCHIVHQLTLSFCKSISHTKQFNRFIWKSFVSLLGRHMLPHFIALAFDRCTYGINIQTGVAQSLRCPLIDGLAGGRISKLTSGHWRPVWMSDKPKDGKNHIYSNLCVGSFFQRINGSIVLMYSYKNLLFMPQILLEYQGNWS